MISIQAHNTVLTQLIYSFFSMALLVYSIDVENLFSSPKSATKERKAIGTNWNSNFSKQVSAFVDLKIIIFNRINETLKVLYVFHSTSEQKQEFQWHSFLFKNKKKYVFLNVLQKMSCSCARYTLVYTHVSAFSFDSIFQRKRLFDELPHNDKLFFYFLLVFFSQHCRFSVSEAIDTGNRSKKCVCAVQLFDAMMPHREEYTHSMGHHFIIYLFYLDPHYTWACA